MQRVIQGRKESHREDTFSRPAYVSSFLNLERNTGRNMKVMAFKINRKHTVPLNEARCSVIWNCPPWSKLGGIPRLFGGEKGKLSMSFLSLTKHWTLNFMTVNSWAPVKG